MAFKYVRFETSPVDDLAVEQALAVWDRLTEPERREVFATVVRAVAVYGRTKDIDRLVRLAESVDGMVRLESTTDLRQAIRETRDAPVEPSGVSFADMARQLEE